VTDIFTGTGWSFGLHISDMAFTEITKIEGIKIEADVIELKTQSLLGQYTRKKLPGRMKSGTITVTRSVPLVGTTYEFTEWIKNVFHGNLQAARRTATIRVFATAMPTFAAGTALGVGPEIMRFMAFNCWPTSIEYGNFQAGDTGTLNEKISIHHEGLYAAPVGDDGFTQPLF
jgi:phage tail-like protein